MNSVDRPTCVTAVFGALLFRAGPIIGQEQFVPQGMPQCTSDIGLHCSSVQRGGGRIVKCLQEIPTISVACKTVVQPTDGAAGNLSIAVTILGIRSKSGFLFVTLSDDAKTFPNGRRMVITPANIGNVLVTFKHLKPGTYAVTAVHDENDNSKFDAGLTGSEGFGGSGNATIPPSFADSAVKVARDSMLTFSMRYF
jgi:uncharacterized protein (DUF2141 family)